MEYFWNLYVQMPWLCLSLGNRIVHQSKFEFVFQKTGNILFLDYSFCHVSSKKMVMFVDQGSWENKSDSPESLSTSERFKEPDCLESDASWNLRLE